MNKIALHGHLHECNQHGHGDGGKIVVTDNNRPTINGVPIALVGDKCMCNDQLIDTIVTGSAKFTINGVQVAIIGSKTDHGGIVVEGNERLTIE